MKLITMMLLILTQIQMSCGFDKKVGLSPEDSDESGEQSDEASPPDPTGADLSYPGPEHAQPSLAAIKDLFQEPLTPYQSGQGRTDAVFQEKHAAILRDPLDHTLPPCGKALPPPTLAKSLNWNLDGAFTEWQNQTPVAIDRAGDGLFGASDHDIRSVFIGEDSDYYYLAVKLESPWVGGSNGARMSVTFANIRLPQSSNEGTLWDVVKRYDYTTSVSESGRSVTGFEASASKGADGVEWRIGKRFLSGVSQTFAIRVGVYDQDYLRSDEIGSHIMGAQDDYACLVDLPKSGRKLFVLRRDPSIPAAIAESGYRAVLNAAPAVEKALNEGYDRVDTIPVTVVVAMVNEGAHTPHSGIYIRSIVYNGEQRRRMREDFSLGAHEYAHGINENDYGLPRRWMVEGHSEWAAKEALADYYGTPLKRIEMADIIRGFIAGEASSYTNIVENAWPIGDHSIRDHYNKAAVFFELFSQLFPYQDFQTILSRGMTSSTYKGNQDFFVAATSHPSFQGNITNTMWHQWFENAGSYTESLLPLTLIEDTDGDGLYNYQESKLGTDPTKSDSDGDGMSDGFEYGAGLDPLTSTKVDHIAIDHLLTDWDTLHPEAMTNNPDQSPEPDSFCGTSSVIKRYVVGYDGNFVIVAAELNAVPHPAFHRALTLAIKEPSGREVDVGIRWQSPVIFGWWRQEEQNLPTAKLIAEPLGATVEFYYHRSWLGWGEQFPVGSTFRLYSYGSDKDGSGNKKICHRAKDIKPFFGF